MPVVKVEMIKGRSLDQKRALAKAITEAVVTHVGVAAEQVWIVIDEVERENWAMAGQLMSER